MAKKTEQMADPTIDRIYADADGPPAPFEFDQDVASVFPNMIERSVPGYLASLELISLAAAQFGQPNTAFYDLGCSRGAATLAMLTHRPEQVVIHGVDQSEAMIAIARSELHGWIARGEVELHVADILDFPVTRASIVVMNYTLQFIAMPKRRALLTRLFEAMVPGGALILSEKVLDEPAAQAVLEDLHRSFKRARGYSDLEIAQKREALLDVLIPESAGDHIQRLSDIGFNAMLLAKNINFCTFLAVKP
ncbi:MAG: carboxy-S-adenosyl-L-methionine synthase CmoA [Pseudomonadales bacterium]|jgi:tRNA (cmo5U34)-methyltransferase